ncbi:MAG TPA: peptidoglycan bridge formation glycyltransferase FemA/FemB family protein [Gammaproteobacteria bacterium]|nr:peptidoglycan bridge formation glycyltransferase FemA/FemB family protein [Gammaproteobacteria bacterium]
MTKRSAASTSPPAEDRWGAWDAFLEATHDAAFLQSSWWADFRTVTGFEHFGAVLRSEGVVVGGALVLRRSYDRKRCFYYIPDGPVIPPDEEAASQIFAATLQSIDEHRKTDPQTVSHLRIEPRWAAAPGYVSGFRTAPSDGYHEPRSSLWIDLRPSEQEILAQMKPKGRYNIRVAQRHGVTVVEDASEQGVADFIDLYEETASRQDFAAKPPDYFGDLVALLTSVRRGSVLFAEHEGTRIAGAIVVTFGRRATYFFGGSLTTHRHLMAPYLLHFEIMRRCKATGHEWYDLWGVAPKDDPNHKWQNITRFKRQFGGVDVDFIPALDYVYDRAAYDRYLAKKNP